LRTYLFLAILIVLIPTALLRPFGGFLTWTWISYFNPHEFTWGFTRELPVGLLVAIPTLVGLLFTRKRKLPALTRETVLVLMLWCWFLLTTLNVYLSPIFVQHLSDTLHQCWLVSKILLMLFVSLVLVTDSRRLRLWYLVTAGSFALFALKAVAFGVVTAGEARVYGPPNSMIADNNDFGLAMNMALPMFLCLSRTEKHPLLRWGFRVSILMAIVAVVLSYSRGALVGLIALLLVWILKAKYKVLSAICFVFVGLVIFISAPQGWIQRMGTLRSAPETDSSALSRLHAWQFARDLARDSPVFGGGFETFTAPLFAQYSLPVNDVHGPHSIYFQMLGEHGFPGLFIFLALISSCYRSCRKIIRAFMSEHSLSYLAEYARMVQLSLVTFLVSGAFLGRAYFDLFYQLVATVVILKCLARRELATSPDLATGGHVEDSESGDASDVVADVRSLVIDHSIRSF
jgi:probable O-glycosylation ligase (exosortase A-associated)